ncbi:MAG: DUF4236 domain-containing protein [Gammaproteobacteria bacterium]|nr:DUF4236 domain-containing protein [Gammaproteobacteria bacterium]
MALRFRRSVRLAPGVRLNIGKRSGSLSLGPRGATLNIGPKGLFRNVGLPGTGLSSRSRIGGGSGRSKPPRKTARQLSPSPEDSGSRPIKAIIVLSDDRSLGFFHDEAEERPLSVELVERLRAERGDFVRAWLEEQCEKQNQIFETLEQIHLQTPSPASGPTYRMQKFEVEPPAEPVLEKPRLLDWVFPKRRARLENRNHESQLHFEEQVAAWRAEKAAFKQREQRRKRLFEKLVLTNVSAMQEALEEQFQLLKWPRETLVSFEVCSDGDTVLVDVDLPEIEDFPAKQFSPRVRAMEVGVDEISDTAKRKVYMAHVHAIGFRIIGVVFSVLPRARTVVLSGFSQRPDKATGHVIDQYLYSVRALRSDWMDVNFDNLEEVDVVEALARFEMRRKMSKTGVFTPIEPFDA